MWIASILVCFISFVLWKASGWNKEFRTPLHEWQPTSTGKMRRPVVSFERLFVRGHIEGEGYSKIIKYFFVEGQLSSSTLEEALKYLQLKHPILGCQVVKDNNQFYYETNPGVAIPVEYIQDAPSFQSASSPEYEQLLDRLVNQTDKYRCETAPSGPLFKMVHVNPTPQEHHLFFVIHHGIADGNSIMVLFNDLMEIITQLPNPINVTPNPLPQSTMSHLDPEHYGLQGFAKFARTLSVIIYKQITKPKLLANEFIQPIPPKNTIRNFNIEVDATPLKNKSKEIDVTVNSYVTAAILLAIRDIRSKLYNINTPAYYYHACAFDIRRILKNFPYKNTTNVAVAGFSFPQYITQTSTIEQVAKEVQEEISSSVKAGKTVDLLNLFEQNLNNLLADRTYSDVVTSISNLGTVDHVLKSSYGEGEKKLVLKGVRLHALATIGRYFGVNVMTFQNKMNIASSNNSCIKQEVADMFKSNLLKYLTA